jgi:hypothetical protein
MVHFNLSFILLIIIFVFSLEKTLEKQHRELSNLSAEKQEFISQFEKHQTTKTLLEENEQLTKSLQ